MASSDAASSASSPPFVPPPKPRDPDMSPHCTATWDTVYEPCEDTYLLMDALDQDIREGNVMGRRREEYSRERRRKPKDTSNHQQTGAHALSCTQGHQGKSGSEQKQQPTTQESGSEATHPLPTSSFSVPPIPSPSPLPPFFPTCLELGPGSGMVLCYLALLFETKGYYLGVDVNPKACAATKRTLVHNKIPLFDVVQGNWTGALDARMRGKIDVLIFNPPYVPTPPEELLGSGISRSWAGGLEGREILDPWLPRVGDLLSPVGVFYLVTIKENRPKQIQAYMLEEFQLESQVVAKRKAGREELQIIRFQRRIGGMEEEEQGEEKVEAVRETMEKMGTEP